jgi:hypothetical protein
LHKLFTVPEKSRKKTSFIEKYIALPAAKRIAFYEKFKEFD